MLGGPLYLAAVNFVAVRDEHTHVWFPARAVDCDTRDFVERDIKHKTALDALPAAVHHSDHGLPLMPSIERRRNP
jgi:hypothetical protein